MRAIKTKMGMLYEYDGMDEHPWNEQYKRLQSGKFVGWTILFRDRLTSWGDYQMDQIRVLPPKPFPYRHYPPPQTSKDWIAETYAGFPLEMSEILKIYWDYRHSTGQPFGDMSPLEFMVRQLQT